MIYAEKLQKTEKRLAQIENDLSQPEVVKDQAKYQKLTKELAEIRPLVNAYAEFCKVENELKALSEELNSKKLDSEMRDLLSVGSSRISNPYE